MNKLPKDVVELITNKLSPREFFHYCKSDEAQEFCARKEIWLRRIQKDFGFLLEGKNKDKLLIDYRHDPQRVYLNIFIKTSTAAEQILEKILENLGDKFLKFMREDYKTNLYDFLFNYLLKMVNELHTLEEEYKIDTASITREYVFENRNWEEYLPSMYRSELYEFWDDEIANTAEKYAILMFHSH